LVAFIFPREFKVWYFYYLSILGYVETFWSHEFSKNSGILQLLEMGPFWGRLFAAQGAFYRLE
jgi:hypothetical protein